MLLLRFLMLCALHAMRAKLEKLDLSLDFLLILLAPVVHVFALLAREFDETVLGHG